MHCLPSLHLCLTAIVLRTRHARNCVCSCSVLTDSYVGPVAGSVATTVPTPEVNVQLKEGDVSCDCPSSGSPLATSGDSLATSGGPLVTRQCSKPQTKAEEVTMRLVSSSPESESSSSGNETLDVGKCAG